MQVAVEWRQDMKMWRAYTPLCQRSGWGATMREAIGDLVHTFHEDFGVEVVILNRRPREQ